MSSSQYILDRINKYLIETGYPKTPVEILESMDVDLLVNDKQETIGLLGYWINESTHLGKVGTIKMVYVDEEYRGDVLDTIRLAGEYMKRLDVKVMELFLDSNFSRFFTEALDMPASTHIHHTNTEEYLNKVTKRIKES